MAFSPLPSINGIISQKPKGNRMFTFLAPLLGQGLKLVANAALVRGSDWIKDKTGIDITQASIPAADMAALKKFEMENRVELAKLALEDNRLAVTLEQAYLADTGDARNMQVAALSQADLFSKRFVYIFAIFWSVCSVAYIGCITFAYIPPENVRFADTILGFLLGTLVAQIINFFYGSSRSSQAKDDTINQIVTAVSAPGEQR